MSWRYRFGLLLIIAVPVLAGLPQRWLGNTLVFGLPRGLVVVLTGAHLALPLFIGAAAWIRSLIAAALITAPVIGAGVGVSVLLHATGLSDREPAVFGPHYLCLAVNKLTVIPLSLGLIVPVPWRRLELRLLQDPDGVGILQKAMLMTVRVFTHIFGVVIPQTLEVLREEGRGRGIGALVGQLGALGLAGICAALRFIGLWAFEIGSLPAKKGR